MTVVRNGESEAAAACRLVVVDDHPVILEGVSSVLDGQPDFDVCGKAGTAREAMSLVRDLKPNVAVLDLSLEGVGGLELIKDLLSAQPDLLILIFSMHEESLYAERALRAGARGYVMKREPPEKVVEGVRRILGGEIFVSERMVSRILKKFVGAGTEKVESALNELTDRELEVFRLIGHGYSTREIADQFCLSVKTIETHRSHIRSKLKVRSTAELVSHAVYFVQTDNLS